MNLLQELDPQKVLVITRTIEKAEAIAQASKEEME